jgi:undecaprenyl-phosphate galactose phosphotransferase
MREQIPFSVTPPLQFLPVNDMTPQYFFSHDVTLLTRTSGLDQPLPRFIKRTFDIVVSLLTLVALSPLFIAIVLMVRKDGGPAVYSHKRLGMNGKAFACLKFRSMIVNSDEVMHQYLEENPDAEAEWLNTRKLRHDPRVTRIGSFLRKCSLDELPQLINVLKGEMSIVGPRPIVVAETDKYDSDIVDYYRVRPGLTGLWQVSGRNNVSYGQRVRMDSWYVRNWSLWHDVMIICKTFPVLLKRVGAY